jgi:hypothetical protein
LPGLLWDFMANCPKISGARKKCVAQIELLLMDVDGTMTDGGAILLSQTEEIALEIPKKIVPIVKPESS